MVMMMAMMMATTMAIPPGPIHSETTMVILPDMTDIIRITTIHMIITTHMPTDLTTIHTHTEAAGQITHIAMVDSI